MAKDPSMAAEYREILTRLDRLRATASESENVPEKIPSIDPTANVLKLVEQAVIRLDDLFTERDKWQERLRAIENSCDTEKDALREKLREAEVRRIDAVNLAESRRIDSVNAETKAAVALASERAAGTAATLAANALTTAQQANERMARLEQQQYQTGGRDIQRERSGNVIRDNIGTIIGVLGFLAAAFAILVK